MISYCIACFRPTYCRKLIDQLVAKTTVRYEILVWINLRDPSFEDFLADRIESGAPIRVLGRTPENSGMSAYPVLFAAAKFEMIVQIDDDVVCVSPLIAERAREIFDRFPQVGMLTADVWQDELTTGARPPIEQYQEISREFGLYDGPIDGWFAIYRKTSLTAIGSLRIGRYHAIGCEIKARLQSIGQKGFLCTRIKVFHVIGPQYASHFGMLDFEIGKYAAVGRQELVRWYEEERPKLRPAGELARRVEQIQASLSAAP